MRKDKSCLVRVVQVRQVKLVLLWYNGVVYIFKAFITLRSFLEIDREVFFMN